MPSPPPPPPSVVHEEACEKEAASPNEKEPAPPITDGEVKGSGAVEGGEVVVVVVAVGKELYREGGRGISGDELLPPSPPLPFPPPPLPPPTL